MKETTTRRKPHKEQKTAVGYYLQLAGTKLLSKEEELKLAALASNGDKKARDTLVCRNIRLVVSVAKHYQNSGMLMEDLVGEGVVGLLTAVDKYNHRLGFRFSTYATWWIRQAVQNAIRSSNNTIKPIHVPGYVRDVIVKAYKIAEDYAANGVNLTFEQAAKRLFLSAKQTITVISAFNLLQARFSGCVGHENFDNDRFIDIEDYRSKSPIAAAESNEVSEVVKKKLRKIPQEQARAVRNCYIKHKTTEEISKKTHASKEKVRRLCHAGLRSLYAQLAGCGV